MSAPKGYSSQGKDDRLTAQFATVEPVRQLQNGLTVNAHQFVRLVGSDACEVGSSTSILIATSHAALVGDVIRFTSGTFSGREVKVSAIASNTITLAETLPSQPNTGDTFDILRHKYPLVDSTGAVSITGSISFTEAATAADGGSLPALTKVVSGYDGTNVQVLKTDTDGKLQVSVAGLNIDTSSSTDIFETSIVNSRYNQLEISFDTTPGANLITNTTSGGGSVSTALGHTTYATSTATTAFAKGVSVQSVKYRPGAELYSYFTASFTTPTSANSYQRIGIYDSNNGFFIGYNGTTFGVTLRTGGADTFTARSSWNGDPLDGSSTSEFTRSGTPEAINLTYSNVFRIRFGWLGSASILFEVLSPDESWVVFHTIKKPNSQLLPSIANPDLPMTIDVSKTSADATDLKMTTGCWAAGASSPNAPITSTLTDNSLAQLTRSVIVGQTTGGGGGYVNVKVNPSGALTVDATLSALDAALDGQKTMANSLPVVIASDQSAVPISASSLPLPTGAATETTLSALNTKVPSGLTVSSTRLLVDGSGVTQPVSGSVSVSNFPATQAVSGTVAATQSGIWSTRTLDGSGSLITSTPNVPAGKNGLDVNVSNSVLTVVQPGAANLNATVIGTGTFAVQATQSGTWSTRTQDGSGNTIGSTSNALDINIKSSAISFNGPGGRTSVLLYRNVYSTTNVTTTAYTQVVASLASAVTIIDIFDSSGQVLVLATGAAGAEVQKAYIYPGGNGQIPIFIAAGTRVSIRAISANAVSGEINMTFYS